MKDQSGLKDGAPLLRPGARIECRPGSDMQVLRLPTASILLSDGAAAILRMCNGRYSRIEIQRRLNGLGYRQSANGLDPFLDAARDRNWVIDLKLSVAAESTRAPACADS